MKYIKSFSESKKEKKAKETDQEMPFDANKLVSDDENTGFKSEVEVIKDSDAEKIKKTIVEPKITPPKKSGK
jgi:hypothetical protein